MLLTDRVKTSMRVLKELCSIWVDNRGGFFFIRCLCLLVCRCVLALGLPVSGVDVELNN